MVPAGAEVDFGTCGLVKRASGMTPANNAFASAPVLLRWDAVPETTHYFVWVYDDQGRDVANATVLPPNTQFTVASLPAGKTFRWNLSANRAGNPYATGLAFGLVYFRTP